MPNRKKIKVDVSLEPTEIVEIYGCCLRTAYTAKEKGFFYQGYKRRGNKEKRVEGERLAYFLKIMSLKYIAGDYFKANKATRWKIENKRGYLYESDWIDFDKKTDEILNLCLEFLELPNKDRLQNLIEHKGLKKSLLFPPELADMLERMRKSYEPKESELILAKIAVSDFFDMLVKKPKK